MGAVRAGWVFKGMEITQIVPYAGCYMSRHAGRVAFAIGLNTHRIPPRLTLSPTVMPITAWMYSDR
jgi:hypothetical protein